MLVFENRGAEVGATIAHPHGQIYAFDFVPDLPRRELERGTLLGDPGDRLVADRSGLARLGAGGADLPARVAARARRARARPAVARRRRPRRARRACSSTSSSGFDRLFDAETPYMLWIHQRPFDGREWPSARLHVEIVTPWRAPGVPRYVAAGELGSGVYFNPVAPEAAAQSLRDAVSARTRRSLESLLYPRRPAELGAAGADEPQPAAADARRSTRGRVAHPRARRRLGFRLVARPEEAPVGAAARAAGTRSRYRASGRCRASAAALHERRDAVRRPPPNVPERTRPASTGARSRSPAAGARGRSSSTSAAPRACCTCS